MGIAFSPDSREIAYITNTSGQFNLWKVPVEGGAPRQLTLFEEETVRSAAWSPKEPIIVLSADQHGDEFYQLYVLDEDGGWPAALTEKPRVQHNLNSTCFSPDGRKLAYFSNERNPSDMDVIIRDVKMGDTHTVLAGDAFFAFVNWSPNGKMILCQKVVSNTNSDIILCDTYNGKKLNMTEHDDEAVFGAGPWLMDNTGFLVATDYEAEFFWLGLYDLSACELDVVHAEKHDIELADLTRDGRLLAYASNRDGYSKLVVEDTRSDGPVKLPKLPMGVISDFAFSPDGRYLAYYLSTPNRIQDLYVIDLKKRLLRMLTDSMLGGVAESDMVHPRLVSYPTFDNRTIPAFLFRPSTTSARHKVPAILSIHGGPQAQERPVYTYAGFYQYLLNRGIGILAPNIRGSTGYGKTCTKMIDRDWGGGDLKDIEASVSYLRRLPWVDPNRIGIFGGSYGGFASLSAVTRLPDYWAAAVDIVGPSNLITFVKSVPPHWKRFMKHWVGDPEEDKALLIERSPITHVDHLKTPILIIQGANDPRVVKAESDQIVEKLKSKGIPVEYMVFEDEGHGFTKRENEVKAWKASAEFFERFLTSSHS